MSDDSSSGGSSIVSEPMSDDDDGSESSSSVESLSSGDSTSSSEHSNAERATDDDDDESMSLGDAEVESSDDGSVSSGMSEEERSHSSSNASRSAETNSRGGGEQSQHSHSTSSNEGSNASMSDDEPETEELAVKTTAAEEASTGGEGDDNKMLEDICDDVVEEGGSQDEIVQKRSESSHNSSQQHSTVSSATTGGHENVEDGTNDEEDISYTIGAEMGLHSRHSVEKSDISDTIGRESDGSSSEESDSGHSEYSESQDEGLTSSEESHEKVKQGGNPSDEPKASDRGDEKSLVENDNSATGSGNKVDGITDDVSSGHSSKSYGESKHSSGQNDAGTCEEKSELTKDGNDSDEVKDGESNKEDDPVAGDGLEDSHSQNKADEANVAAENSLRSEISDDAVSSREKHVETVSSSLGGGSAVTSLSSIDGSSDAPLNRDDDQSNAKPKIAERSLPPPPPVKRTPPLPPRRLTQENLQKKANDNSAFTRALEKMDDGKDTPQDKVSDLKSPIPVAETSKPAEANPDDGIVIGDTSNLTPMEKLKLAAKYGNEKNVNKVQFMNLLESSIRDLETMELDSEGKQVKDTKRSVVANMPRTPDTYGSKPSRTDSKRSRNSRSSRRSHNSRRSDRSRNHQHRSQNRSTSSLLEGKSETQKEWESYLSRNSASNGAVVPQAAKDVLACVKKSDPLPRESVVSNVVRELVAMRISHEENEGCVAILGENGVGGTGKSTVAALVCNRGDIRTRYCGISWVSMRSAHLDFERYSKNLSDICRQIGVKPHHLRLSPFVRSPGEDPVVANLRMKAHMEEARFHMGKLLTSVQRKRWKNSHKILLVVLDDVKDESEIGWFQFRHGGEGDKINDIVVTSRATQINGAVVVTVPPLNMKESTRLFLTEADLPLNHRIANTTILKDFLKACHHHPLAIRHAGRWLNLKRATAGGQKGTDEVLAEITESTKMSGGSCLDVLYAMMHRSMSPLVNGAETKIIRLCFAAFVTVFCDESYSAPIPFEVATEFFLKVVENESAALSNEDPLFKSHGRRASMLVPQILGALGVFSITKHSTTAESEKKESSIKIESEVTHSFCKQIFDDIEMQHLVRHSEQRWNEAYVQSYLHAKTNFFWDNLQPDKSRKYALEKAPAHMIQAAMFNDVELLLRNESFIRGRFWYQGWTEGTRAHVDDIERFWDMVKYERDESDVITTFEQLESVLMEEVAREAGGPNGRCTTLEAGRCLHEISLSLAKLGLFNFATKFCNTCIKLVESNLGPSELVAALLYNSSLIHAEANEFGVAEEKISECMKIRVKTSGQENILYVRSLCLMGDILSTMSDYVTAQTCFDKAIGILKIIPPRYHLDFGIVLYKLGRNQHRRGGYLDDALQCYEEAHEFEKVELGDSHSFIASLLTKKGEVLLQSDDVDLAIQNFEDALQVLNDALKIADDDSSPFLRSKILILEGFLLSVSAESKKCIVKFKQGLKLLQRFSPNKKLKMAQLTYLVGSEYEKQGDYKAADKLYQDSITLVKEVLGPTHLDIAETLVNQSGVKSALGESNLATACLNDAIDIQRTRLGTCEEVAITLTILGAHLTEIGNYEKAEQAYNEAVQILRSLNNDLDLSLVDALLGMAGLLNETADYVQAMECYVECLEIQKSVYGKSHDDIASTLYAMGLTKINQKLYSRALTFFQKALDIRVGIHGEADPSVRDTYSIMGFTEAASGDLDGALRKLGDALRVSQLLGDRLKEAETLSNIGNVHREKEEWELALEHYDNCMSIRIAELGRDHESVAEALMAIGNVKSDMSKQEDAVKSYKDGESKLPSICHFNRFYLLTLFSLKALQILLRVVPENNKRIASTIQKIGMIQFRAGNLEGATLHLQKAVEIYQKDGKDVIESDIVSCLFVIGNIHNVLNQKDEAKDVWAGALEASNGLGSKRNDEVHRTLCSLLSAGA